LRWDVPRRRRGRRRHAGPRGEYIDADGGRCPVDSAWVSAELPIPGDERPSADTARGSVLFSCLGADEVPWHVDGQFAIVVMSTFVLCAD
jgi:hypothetical protein